MTNENINYHIEIDFLGFLLRTFPLYIYICIFYSFRRGVAIREEK